MKRGWYEFLKPSDKRTVLTGGKGLVLQVALFDGHTKLLQEDPDTYFPDMVFIFTKHEDGVINLLGFHTAMVASRDFQREMLEFAWEIDEKDWFSTRAIRQELEKHFLPFETIRTYSKGYSEPSASLRKFKKLRGA
jgi:hypothetical protein